MKNKTFIIYIMTVLFAMLFGLAFFNYTFDNYGFFKQNNGESFAAKAVSAGHSIAGLENYDERLFQREVFQNFKTYPESITIGSSRAMLIQASMVKNSNKYFNHSVSGASLEDYIAILGLYTQKEIPLKKVILGVDPWIFNKNNGQNRWLTLSNEYNFMLGYIKNRHTENVVKKYENKYLQLINFENTKNNISQLGKNKKILIIKNENIDSMIKRGDGSIVYPYKIRYQKDSETRILVKKFISGDVYGVENFKELSDIQLFESLVQFLLKKGVTVEIFLPPYHPDAYSYFCTNGRYSYVMKSEEYIRKFAKTNNIRIYGSYNPNIDYFTSEDFTDGMHAKATVSNSSLNAKEISKSP